MAITTCWSSACLSVYLLVILMIAVMILNRTDPFQPAPGSLHLDGALVDVETPEIQVVVLLSTPKQLLGKSWTAYIEHSMSLVHFDSEQLADSLCPFSGMSIEQNKKHGRGQGADGGQQQQQPHRKMRLLLLQQDHQAQKGEESGSKYRYECSGGGVETKNNNKKKDGMVLRIRDNNKSAADSAHLQHIITRRKRIIPETLENYRLPRRKVAFSSDRMVPTGPNPLHNYSNISSEVIGIP
ncbi:unnamed protein product [Sphagnum jensenii]|uniref:Uncharacterized protein n=1 Tax=Sphagnum jensenii TaxID=128206 RepID=A0ABP1BPF2_9BRYO